MQFGKIIRNASREALRIYVAAHLAARILRMTDQPVRILKEGPMNVFDAESLNLQHLGPEAVSYQPRGIHTEAIQVTPENIGKLSLEFQEEMFYDQSGRPYFVFSAKRFAEDEPDGQTGPSELFVRLTDWIVPLWGELHIFRDHIFQNTFTFDSGQGVMRTSFDASDPLSATIMQSALQSADPELRNFAGKLQEIKPSPTPRES